MWICSEQTSTTFNSVTWDVFFLAKNRDHQTWLGNPQGNDGFSVGRFLAMELYHC